VLLRDSGQFNYHLGKLVDRFVTRTEEGCELTQPGIQVNGAIDAGSYTLARRSNPGPSPDTDRWTPPTR